MKILKQNLINRKKALYLYMGFFSCMTLATACKEKDFSKSVDGIPEVDNIHTFEWKADSFKVNHSYIDTLWTNDNDYPLAAIGKIENDPYFGKTNAGLYIQFSTPDVNYKFPEGMILDSTVLSIPYFVPANNSSAKMFYGDTSKNMVFHVHKIDQEFEYKVDKQYFANDQLSYASQPLAQKTFALSSVFDTMTFADGVTTQNILRINLPNSFGQEIINLDPAQHLTTVMDFQKYFPGFYIQADPTSNVDALGLFNVNDGSRTTYPFAQILFYYHKQGDTTISNVYFPFKYSNSAWFNSIRRNYSGYPAQNYVSVQDSDSIVVQGAPGISSIIEIPIDRLPVGVVNKAELALTVANVGGEHFYLPPNQIIVKGIDESGNDYNIADFVTGIGFSYIGGSSTVEEFNNTNVIRYRFNMPREVQKLRDEGKNVLRVRISASTAHLGFYRAVFYGKNEVEGLKPNFKVIYSVK